MERAAVFLQGLRSALLTHTHTHICDVCVCVCVVDGLGVKGQFLQKAGIAET